jgi:hypothetical protein
MPPHQQAAEIFDLIKVGAIGTGGTVATLKLADISLMVSIGVGVVTFLYITSKLILLWRNNGKTFDDRDS